MTNDLNEHRPAPWHADEDGAALTSFWRSRPPEVFLLELMNALFAVRDDARVVCIATGKVIRFSTLARRLRGHRSPCGRQTLFRWWLSHLDRRDIGVGVDP